jgi:ligand-binding sensor domain-containing protein
MTGMNDLPLLAISLAVLISLLIWAILSSRSRFLPVDLVEQLPVDAFRIAFGERGHLLVDEVDARLNRLLMGQ